MTQFCASCGASIPRESKVCAECGAKLDRSEPEAVPATPESRSHSPADAESRAEGSTHRHEIRSGKHAMARVQWCFAVIGLLGIVTALILAFVWAPGDAEPGQPTDMIAFALVVAAISIVGVWRASRRPRVWAIALIALTSLGVIFVIVTRGFIPPVFTFLMIASWGLLGPIIRMRRIQRSDPDAPRMADVRRGSGVGIHH